MNRFPEMICLAILLSLVMAAALSAAEECCPAETAEQSVQLTGDALPEGHPPIDRNATPQGKLPPGHPPMSGQSAPSGQLPSGHPPIDGMNGMGMQAPGPVTGSIAIKAVQGTRDAEPVGLKPVTVDLYQRGKLMDSIEAQLDADGVVILEDIEFTGVVQPVVRLEHNGATFQTAGHPMAASKPEQMIRLNVYETTHEKPDWSIKMRHVLVRRMGNRLHVTEMVAVSNPVDRAWIGPEPDKRQAPSDKADAGHRATAAATLQLSLPEQATAFEAGPGLDACCAEVSNSTLKYYKPMMPGLTQVGYTYQLPADEQGRVSLELQTPVQIAQLMLFVPKDGMTADVQGMQPGQSIHGKAMEVRVFQAASVKPTDTISLTIGELNAAPQPQAEPAAMDRTTESQPQTSKLIAGIGGGALLAGAVGVLLFGRGPKRNN